MENSILGTQSMLTFIQESIALNRTAIVLLAQLKAANENKSLEDVQKELDVIYQRNLDEAKAHFKLKE